MVGAAILTGATQAKPEPAAEPKWLGAQRSRDQAASEQPTLRAELIAQGLPPEAASRAVRLWNELMRGITYGGGHRTALGILTGAFKHRSVPDLPEPHPDELAPPGDGPIWSARAWPVYNHANARAVANFAAAGGGSELGGFDVNGMYLSAAASELGTGRPERAEWPDEQTVLSRPGWVRVSTLEGAPWSIASRWEEGMWMPTPLVAYLRDAGAQFLVPEAVTQPEHRRWLDPHVDLLRAARAALVLMDTPEAVALLAIVKDIYTRMFGGLLESVPHNKSRTLRPWWKANVIGTGQARMFRALDKVTTGTVMCVGIHVDAAYFVMPAKFVVPPGLPMQRAVGEGGPEDTRPVRQLGKWKPAGRAPWTGELAAAYGLGNMRPLWNALHPEVARATA